RALQTKPAYAAAHSNIGVICWKQGRLNEAIASCERALQIKPDYAEAHTNLGAILREQGRLDEAIASHQQALQIKPEFAEAHCNLGNALFGLGRLDEAIASHQQALQIKPEFAEAHCNLGNALFGLGRLDEAISNCQRALQINPDYAEAHCNLGSVLFSQGRLDEAIVSFQRALQINPDSGEAHNNLGTVLFRQGRLDEAIVSCQRALKINPSHEKAHSNLLMFHQYKPGITLDRLAIVHAEWNRIHGTPLQRSYPLVPSSAGPEHRLRLGFVSPDLGLHPVGYFLVRLLESLDPTDCETFCYSDRLQKDVMTTRISAAVGTFRDSIGKSDEELANEIQQDNINVLFDLSGHTAQNRLLVFARKPAPVQMSWIGYLGTTGLDTMDYLVADRFNVPPVAEQHYSERILRLQEGFVCFDPPADAPDVGALPAASQGHVTFGCFNNLGKINNGVIGLWAEILRRLPDSRLMLKGTGFDDDAVAARLRESFEQEHGIDAHRLELLGKSSYAEYLDTYNRIDIAVDPFPFGGGTTTCESLWMGVPVITCPGETFAGRLSFSHLSVVGLTETVAESFPHYVELAVQLANDLPRLQSIRATLRQRMAQSPLCDGERFATNFIRSVQQAWEEYLSNIQLRRDC
ncbi:MAG: tetratricopeptide repeat protein, partial [Planctomycetota bacterium]|nr:tetratricopeptide repeat protein [Planctomycetota bacterium]